MKRLVIIDGKSVFYRGYYAMSDLRTSANQPVGGVYGFSLLALNIIKKLQPDYVCVAWDKSKTNIRARKRLYKDYKANRQSAPADFYDQIPILFDLLQAFNWPLYELDDYEADDIMATLAQQAGQKDVETILVSSDLDLLQAIDKNTKMYVIKGGLRDITAFDEKAFVAKYNLAVHQFRDLKALMGDSSDNIPGVAGIGQKRATQLLLDYQTLDNIYDNLDKIPAPLADKLKQDKQMAFLSRQLVTLMTDAPIKLDLQAMAITNLNVAKLDADLRKLEFYSLLNQIPQQMQLTSTDKLVAQTKLALKKPKVQRHKSLAELKELDWRKPVFLHAYCAGRFGQQLVHLLASDDGKTLHVYSANKRQVNLKLQQAVIYGYNTQVLCQVLTDLGVSQIKVAHDVHMTAFLFNSLLRAESLSLSALALDKLGYLQKIDAMPPEDFVNYAPELMAIIVKLKQLQEADLQQAPSLHKLAQTIEWPFIPVLARLERVGMRLDASVLQRLEVEFQTKIRALEKQIFDLAGEEFNLSSPRQLAKILYGKLQIPTIGIKKRQLVHSTDAEALAKLRHRFPIVVLILNWRELSKLQQTYVKGLLKSLGTADRVYSEMRLTGAATGRLSSVNPNLQNIPIKTAIGRSIRTAFVAPRGYQLVSADYNQFELRLAAVLAQDEAFIEAFNQNQDIHRLTARVIFGVDLKKVTNQQRYLAKAINFGVLYGQGPRSLATLTGMSFADAQQFIDKYFKEHPAIRTYHAKVKQQAIQQGYVETLFGRRRQLPDIKHQDTFLQAAAFRQAINMPIQGTEADLMKLAMTELDRQLDADCRQVMQVHDSILVECPTKKVKQVATLMQTTMENIYPTLGIDLKVDVSSAKSWPA